MDLLYRAYSSPLDLMNRYINQGRFGDFVEGFCKEEYERRKQEQEKMDTMMLWMGYVHSEDSAHISFADWKKRILKQDGSSTTASIASDKDLDDDRIAGIIDNLFRE